MDSMELVISEGNAKLVDFGQFGNKRLTNKRREELTMRLIEMFNMRVFPLPTMFSDEEIECIAGWGGMDDKATFTDGDERLISEYNLDPAKGENTYPKFAEILRKRKTQPGARKAYDQVAEKLYKEVAEGITWLSVEAANESMEPNRARVLMYALCSYLDESGILDGMCACAQYIRENHKPSAYKA